MGQSGQGGLVKAREDKIRSGWALTWWLGRMLARYWRAKHSPAHWQSILTGTGSTGLVLWLPLDPLCKLFTIEYTGCSKEVCHHGNLNTFIHPYPSQPMSALVRSLYSNSEMPSRPSFLEQSSPLNLTPWK